MFREVLTIMMIFLLLFVGRRWLFKKGGRGDGEGGTYIDIEIKTIQDNNSISFSAGGGYKRGKGAATGGEGGTSRQTELRLTSVAALYKTRLQAADDEGNANFVVH